MSIRRVITMSCYIDGTFVNERYFWASLQSLANQAQIARILEGQKVKVAESVYWIERN